MFLYLVFLLALALWKTNVTAVNQDYLGRHQTDAIKGFFILLVFLSHIRGYISTSGVDWSYSFYDWFLSKVGQRMVAMFLFCSGYGVMESLQRKDRYLDSFLFRRVFLTWFHFALALLLFVCTNLITGISCSAREYVLCWTGWESIGNSNWYIFDILVLYLLTWIVFRTGRRFSLQQNFAVMFILCVLFAVMLKAADKESRWYNTVLCYPLGMAASLYRNSFFEHILNSHRAWNFAILVTAVLFTGTFFFNGIISYTVNVWCFCLLIVLLSMRIKIGNGVLEWCGRHLFPLYILQRIPMIILTHYEPSINPFLLTGLSLILTVVIAAGFQRFTVRVDRLILEMMGDTK